MSDENGLAQPPTGVGLDGLRAAAARAREAYRCLEPYRDDPERYGQLVAGDPTRSCEAGAVRVFDEMEARADDHARRTGGDGVLGAAEDELLLAHQSARIVKNAEGYYRLGTSGMSSWNLRDQHMSESLNELVALLDSLTGRPTKVVVWAHNTHAGDARVTEMGERGGELNVGQLIRQGHAERSFLVGFTTYHGTVLAAREWGRAGERRTLRPALPGSYAAIFHEAPAPSFLLLLNGGGEAARQLEGPRLQRAVGVVYLPETERQSHYFLARLSRQFDAVIHWDSTRAVTPLP
jgi:erythromycin esterase-like protein